MKISFIDFSFCITETPAYKDKYLTQYNLLFFRNCLSVDELGQHYIVEGELDFNIQKTRILTENLLLSTSTSL